MVGTGVVPATDDLEHDGRGIAIWAACSWSDSLDRAREFVAVFNQGKVCSGHPWTSESSGTDGMAV